MFTARNLYFLIILLLFATLVLRFFVPISFYVFIVMILAIIALLAYGSSTIKADFFTKAYHSPTHSRPEIAITFDDGPTEFTSEILDILKEYDAKATFFCIGKQVEQNQKVLKRMHDEGHEIGNHSYSHSNFFPFFKKHKIEDELRKTSLLIENCSGNNVANFRPPFGVINNTIVKAAQSNNLKIVGWNLRSFDGVKINSERVLQRIIPNIKSGTVLLLHDSRPDSGIILRKVLEDINLKNLRPVTVTQIFNIDESH